MSLFKDAQLNRKQAIMTTLLIAGSFISVLNQTIISPPLPSIMSDLGINVSQGQWLLSVFTLVMAIMIPMTPFLLDRFPIKRLFIASMIFMIAGSLLLAWGPTFPMLILGRILQAISSGILVTMITSMLMWIFPLGFRGRAMGLYTLVIGCAPAIGPTYSGIIVDLLSWHLVFLSIVPLAAIVAVTAFFVFDDFKELKNVTLDKQSIILSTLGLGLLLYGCSIIGSTCGLSIESVITIVIGLAILVLFGIRQLKLKEPVLELRVLKNRSFLTAAVIIMLFQAGILAWSVILPIYIQTIRGYSATITGLIFLPGSILMAIMSMASGKVFDRHGPRIPTLIGAAALMISMLALITLNTTSPLFIAFIIYGIFSIGIALLNTPLATWALTSLDDKEVHHGSAVLNTVRQAAGAIGTAILVTVMSITMSSYPDPESITANMAGFNATAICMAAIMVVIFVVSFILVREKKDICD